MPEISVIMSVYNGERFLANSIESVLNQTFTNFEFLIIDDCSTDKSAEIIRQYSTTDNRIKYLKNKQNIGLTKSLNKALQIAQGKYIARMDADDISLPERFRKQYNFLEKNQNTFLIGGWAIKIDEKAIETDVMKTRTSFNQLKKWLPKMNSFIHSTIMFRHEKNIFYREKFVYAQDYDFYLNLLSQNKMLCNLPEILIKYRETSDSISIKNKLPQYLLTQKAKVFFAERKKNGYDSYAHFNYTEYLTKSSEAERAKLEIQIYNHLHSFEKTEIRKKTELYLKTYGLANKFFLYYIVSFLGQKVFLSTKKIFSL